MPPKIVSYANAAHYDTDVFADAGSPTYPINVQVSVSAITFMKSTSTAIPCMNFVGFHIDSRITLINRGTIEAKGGAGGDAVVWWGFSFPLGTINDWYISGSGGGGAGCDTALAGLTADPAVYLAGTRGIDGASKTAGAGGIGDPAPPFVINPPPDDGIRWDYFGGSTSGEGIKAESGGDAIRLGESDIQIYNAGAFLLGGGGGGAGGTSQALFTTGDGWAGGANGVAGESVFDPFAQDFRNTGGDGGFAIRYAGAGTAFIIDGFMSPNVEGQIGAS